LGDEADFALANGVCFGVVALLLSMLLSKRKREAQLTEGMPYSGRKTIRHFLANNFGKIWLFLGLIFALCGGLSDALGYFLGAHGITLPPDDALKWGLTVGDFYWLGIGIILVFGGILLSALLRLRKETIEPAERIVWSWGNLKQSLFSLKHIFTALTIGLFVGLLVSLCLAFVWGLGNGIEKANYHFIPALINGLYFVLDQWPSDVLAQGLSVALIVFIIYWLQLSFLRSISSNTLPEADCIRPNEGLLRSAHNSLVMGCLNGLIGGVCVGLGAWLGGIFPGQGDMSKFALEAGIRVGVALGLLSGLFNGGLACLQHSYSSFAALA
jgi:hypothetical protein